MIAAQFNVFQYLQYKDAVRAWVTSQPKQGYGQFRKLAEAIGMSTVMVSQIFKGDRDIGVDHALAVAEFLALGEPETRYFILLVEYARAANSATRNFFAKQIEELKRESTNLKKVLGQEKELGDAQKAVFHSNWTYSAVRLLLAVDRYADSAKVAATLALPEPEVRRVITYLLENGLAELNEGVLAIGPQRTHLEKSSPYIVARQKTWRVKGFECMDRRHEEDFFFTGPMSTSAAQIQQLKQEFAKLLKSMSDRVVAETPENLYCLNIDLFRVNQN